MSNSLSPAAAVRRWLPDVLLVVFAAAMTIFCGAVYHQRQFLAG